MAVRKKHSSEYATYFITLTCTNWLPLIDITNSYDCIYSWFSKLKSTYHADVVAYVIMPNHLHLILHFNHHEFNLNSVISNGKRFLAYTIIHRLVKAEKGDLLQELRNAVTENEYKKGQQHKVFNASFDAKPVFTQHFMMQKVNYIHYNPVRGKWMLAADWVTYPHSSASFYATGLVQHFKPVHYADITG